MPPKAKRNKAVNINPDELILNCEWMDCKETYTNMDKFTEHVTAHLSQYIIAESQGQVQDETKSFSCHWRECSTEIEGETSDFERHVYFHIFHVKIKCVGSLLTERTGQKACTLGTQCRNLIPELPERLECGWSFCHQYYENAEMFYRHVENHTSCYPDGNCIENGCPCQWEGCNVKVKSRYKLREHMRSHTQEKIVACPTCGNLFSSRTKYFDHVTRQMDVYTGKRYQCSHCNRTFPLERLLRDHMRNHVNQYKCPYCDMTMPSPACLRKHIRYRHTDEKPYKCEECTYRCKSLPDLKKHLEVHSKDGAYQCEDENCTYSSRSYANLASHIKNTHQEVTVAKYQCHMCSSNFTRGYKLTKHLKNKHKFSWPSGHSRFRYKLHSDGMWRLQTVRYETVELSVHPDIIEPEAQETLNPGTSTSTYPGETHQHDQETSLEMVTNTENNFNDSNVIIGVHHTDQNAEEIKCCARNKKRRRSSKTDAKESDIHTELREESDIHMEHTEESAPENSIDNNNEIIDNSMNMIELSITKTNDGKFLLKTAGCNMEEPMTIMMADYGEELQENMYNLQMLGDVALQNQNLQ